jgi:lambda repressor-like predicted transcriptional regulator
LARVGFCAEEVKPFGPVHEYVAPLTVGVESEIVWPEQYGPPLLAIGVAGVALTATLVLPAAEVQPLTVTVTEYVPASDVVALDWVGFCSAEVKPFGPVQAYVAPETVGVDSTIVWPEQYGPPLLAVGVAGVALTATLVVPAAEVQPLTVTVTEYVPASAVVALDLIGFCSAEVKPFGPVHAYVAPLTVGVESEIV